MYNAFLSIYGASSITPPPQLMDLKISSLFSFLHQEPERLVTFVSAQPCGYIGVEEPTIAISAALEHIAKKLGISPINLEKLTSLQKKKNISEFSANDLVFYLDITPRSATRILKKLVECGAAEQIDSVHLNNRGRPSAIYKINLDNIK